MRRTLAASAAAILVLLAPPALAATAPMIPELPACYGVQGVNLNTAAPPVDIGTIQLGFPASNPTPNWRPRLAIVKGESISLTTASIQIWTGANGTGLQITNGTQTLTTATGGATNAIPATVGTSQGATNTLTVREIAAQGAAATADVYVCLDNTP